MGAQGEALALGNGEEEAFGVVGDTARRGCCDGVRAGDRVDDANQTVEGEGNLGKEIVQLPLSHTKTVRFQGKRGGCKDDRLDKGESDKARGRGFEDNLRLGIAQD